jgi:hypothetical protein
MSSNESSQVCLSLVNIRLHDGSARFQGAIEPTAHHTLTSTVSTSFKWDTMFYYRHSILSRIRVRGHVSPGQADRFA